MKNYALPPNINPKLNKDEIINKKWNKEISDPTADDRNTKADEMHVSKTVAPLLQTFSLSYPHLLNKIKICIISLSTGKRNYFRLTLFETGNP